MTAGRGYPVAPPVGPLPRRPVGVDWREPMSTPARWCTGAALLCAGVWLFAFSDPSPSAGWAVVAAAATLVLAVVGGVAAANRRRAQAYRLSPRRPGRAVAALVLIAAATAVLCATQAPMWLRFYQARPALLELATEAQRGGGGHRALAGTYYLYDFGLQAYRYESSDPGHPGYIFFFTNNAGLFTDAGYVYSPLGSPAGLDRAGGSSHRQYRHLTGQWWTFSEDY